MPSSGGEDYLINSQYFRVQVSNDDKWTEDISFIQTG